MVTVDNYHLNPDNFAQNVSDMVSMSDDEWCALTGFYDADIVTTMSEVTDDYYPDMTETDDYDVYRFVLIETAKRLLQDQPIDERLLSATEPDYDLMRDIAEER